MATQTLSIHDTINDDYSVAKFLSLSCSENEGFSTIVKFSEVSVRSASMNWTRWNVSAPCYLWIHMAVFWNRVLHIQSENRIVSPLKCDLSSLHICNTKLYFSILLLVPYPGICAVSEGHISYISDATKPHLDFMLQHHIVV